MREQKRPFSTPDNTDAGSDPDSHSQPGTDGQLSPGAKPRAGHPRLDSREFTKTDADGWLPVPRRWALQRPPILLAARSSVAKPRRVHVRQLGPVAALFVATALVLYFLPAVSAVVLLALAAGGLAAALRPLMGHLPGPRTLRALLLGFATAAVILGVLSLAVALVIRPVREQLNNWPQLKDSLNTKLNSWEASTGIPMPDVSTLGREALSYVGSAGGAKVLNIFAAVTNVGVIALVVMIGAMYLLITPPIRLFHPLTRDFSPARQRAIHSLFRDLDVGLRGWLHSVLISMSSAAILTYVGYRIAGLHFAPAIALLAGISETVPNLGPLAAFAVAFLIALTQSTTTVIWVVSMYLIMQTIQSYGIQPLAVKRTVRIPEVITLLSIIAWGSILGAPGLLMATPLNLLIWAIYEHFLRPNSTARATSHRHARQPRTRSPMQLAAK